MDSSTEEGTSIAVLGEPDSRHVRRAVYGGGRDLRCRHIAALSGGYPVAVEQNRVG